MWTVIVGIVLFTALSLRCLIGLCHLTFCRACVHNSTDQKDFITRDLPGFIHQRPESPRLLDFRKYIVPLISESTDQLAKVIIVRRWVRDQQSDSPEAWRKPYVDDSEDPHRLLQEQRQGAHGACRRFAYILAGSLVSIGLEARLVHIAETFRDSGRNHTLVEVWIDGWNKWVLVDPTFDTFILIDGAPASMIEMYRVQQTTVMRRVSFQRDGSSHLPVPTWAVYDGLFKHLYIAKTNAFFDGYRLGLFGPKKIAFLHLVDKGVEPHPQRRKELLAIGCTVSALAALIMLARLGIGRTWGQRSIAVRFSDRAA